MKKTTIFLMALFFSSFVIAINYIQAEALKCSSYGDKNLSRADYDKILQICEKEIEAEKKVLSQKKGQTAGVSSEVKKLERANAISRKYIQIEDLKLKQLRRGIGENEAELEVLGKNIFELKESLKRLLYKKYQYKKYSFVEVMFSDKSISDFFRRAELISLLEKKISNDTKRFTRDEENIEKLMNNLEKKSELEEKLIEEKKVELEKIKRNTKYKQELLGILKKEVGVSQKNISIREKIKQEILRKKYALASGKKVSFGEAYYILKPYQNTLKIDPAFILAILFQESG
jgi:septal ring factor EnvC (AmiA/AmiB activator)